MIVPLPFHGKSSTSPASMQKPGTSSDLLNMRPFSGASGKDRFSQRSGLSPFAPAISASRVDLMAQVTYDSRKFTYAAGSGSEVWRALVKDTKRAVLDRQGNLIAVEGAASIVKVNDAGEVVWRLTLPMADGRHEVLALFVDSFDNLYIGASSGGDQTTAKFWRYTQKSGSQTPTMAWEETPGAFVRKIRTRGNLIYTLQNMPDRAQAYVVAYTGALTTGLTEAWRTEVAYPANSFDLKDNGDVVGCSLANATRGIDPRFPKFTERTIDYRITDLDHYHDRIWGWWKASAQPARYGKDSNGDDVLQDGSDLTYWYDSSGNDRDLFLSIRASSLSAPKYDSRGIGGKPSISFRGTTGGVAATLDELQSALSPSTTAAYSDSARGLVPCYAGAKWVMFLVVRMEDERPTPTIRPVWGQNRATGGTGTATTLFSNRSDAGVATSGVGSYVDSVTAGMGGLGAGNQPFQFNYGEAASGTYAGNDTGTCVITIVNDGGDVTLPDGANVTHSLLRVNGQPIDRWVSTFISGGVPQVSTDPGYLGFYHGAAGPGHFRGHIAEIIVLHDYAGASKGLLSHPNYPRNVGTTVANIYSAVTPSNATEMEKIEGMLAHEYGISHLLPTGAYIAPTFGPYVVGNYPHPFYRTAGPPRSPGSGTRSEPYQMQSKQGCVWKLDGSKGELQWVVTGSSGEDGGGLGTSVVVRDDAIYSVGPKVAPGSPLIDGTTSAVGTGNINVRLFKDLNLKGTAGYDTSVALGREGWIATLGTTSDDFSSTDIEAGLDDYGNLYVPLNYSAIGPYLVNVYASAPDVSGTYNVGNVLLTYGTDQGYQAILPPSPSYRFGATYDFDRNPTTDARQARTEFVYVTTTAGVAKVRLVDATPIDGTPRQTALYQVNAGVLRRFDAANTYTLAGASTIAEPQLSTTAQYVDGCVLFGKLFLTDGEHYYYVSPLDDACRTWKPTDGGKMDPRNKLICAWNGRVVTARGVDDPHVWNMSAKGNPFSWDQFAVPQLSTRAVSGSDPRYGKCPDVINAIFPYSEDVLLFFCDHSIQALVGDPSDTGRAVGFRVVSSVVGGSFGRSVCSDPAGNVYFFGSQGGVFIMRGRNSEPESISDDTIYSELRDIDLGAFRAELCWNVEDNTLHVFFFPFGSAEPVTHYAWSPKKGWFPDEYAVQPSALLVSDGDAPGDRRLLLGCTDGEVRFWDRGSKNDDGEAIEIRTLIGPLAPEESDFEYRFSNLQVTLARDSDPVRCNVYASDTPDKKGDVRAAFDIQPGRNGAYPLKIAGSYVWVEFLGKHAQRTVSFESARFLSVAKAGRRKVRL